MDKQGLTLMEVIIAALILSVAVAGVLFVFSTEKGVVARTGRKFQASEFTRQTLEGLKDEVGADTWSDPSGALWQGQHSTGSLAGTELGDTFGATRSYEVTDGPADDAYRSVTVTVDWDEPLE